MTNRRSIRWARALIATAALQAGIAEDGKMPITTSSEAARRAYQEGIVYSDRSQPERARPLFERAIELDPDFIMAYDALARVSPTFKDAGEAFRKVEALAARVPMSDGERLYFDALFAGFRGDRPQQLQKLQQLAELYPRDERVFYQLGLFHYGNDDEEAVRIFEKALSINPSFVPVYNRMGYSLRALGETERAELAFKKAIELDPDSPNAYDSYGELLLKLGRFDESIANYDQALEREPLFPSAQIGVAANLILQDEHELARKRLERLFDIAPHDGIRSGIHWALAVTYADEGNLEEALAELEKNFELSRRSGDAAAMDVDLRNIAAVLIESERYEEARTKLDEALDVIVTDPSQNERRKAFARGFHAYGTGVVAARRGDLDDARAKVVELETLVQPLDSNFMDELVHELDGIIRLAAEDYAAALAELRQANATEVYNMYRIALAYEGLGDVREAHKMLEYVVTYHSPLNFNYAFVRRKALDELAGAR